jgi:hypothetical protein
MAFHHFKIDTEDLRDLRVIQAEYQAKAGGDRVNLPKTIKLLIKFYKEHKPQDSKGFMFPDRESARQ